MSPIPNPLPKNVLLPTDPVARRNAMIRLGWIDADAPLTASEGPGDPEYREGGQKPAASATEADEAPVGVEVDATEGVIQPEDQVDSTADTEAGAAGFDPEVPMGAPPGSMLADDLADDTHATDADPDDADPTPPTNEEREVADAANTDEIEPGVTEEPGDTPEVEVGAEPEDDEDDEDDEDEPESEPSDEDAIPDDETLTGMTALDLRKMAKAHDLDLDSIDARKKDELLGLLRRARDGE